MEIMRVQDARRHFAELIENVLRGESIGITRWGRLVAVVRPPSQDERNAAEQEAGEAK